MTERGAWAGMWTIVRFNWTLYVLAGGLLVGSLTATALLHAPLPRLAAALATGGCLWFLVGSLGTSHWVYDLSDLYCWRWLDRALGGQKPSRIILCHSGFDEASPALQKIFPTAAWRVLDHYDAATMTEPSIHRARRLFPPTPETIAARADAWPTPSAGADLIFGILAIHELRTPAALAAWFAEARRNLETGGRVVIIEHVRDFANFLAFGPGFLHFHSPAMWHRAWSAAGLRATGTFRVTPFLRVFVLQT
jgi:hypothetical protein